MSGFLVDVFPENAFLPALATLVFKSILFKYFRG